jgi:hypothetical protein
MDLLCSFIINMSAGIYGFEEWKIPLSKVAAVGQWRIGFSLGFEAQTGRRCSYPVVRPLAGGLVVLNTACDSREWKHGNGQKGE